MVARDTLNRIRDVEAFEQFVKLPANAERTFEYIGGEIVEVPSNAYVSYIAIRIASLLFTFVEHHKLGYVTGEAGGYSVAGERYAPDVAYISKERQPELAKEGYNPNPPNLAFEIVSPSDDPKKLSIKVANYTSAGTVVAVVYPSDQEVVVYRSGQPAEVLQVDDTFAVENILPGFKLTLKDIFPEQPTTTGK